LRAQAADTDNANFFKGGVPSVSPSNLVSCSTLRFVPARLDSGDGDIDGAGDRDFDFLNSSLSVDGVAVLGGVDRDTEGVPGRLWVAISFRKRAARLFVDATASA